MFGRMKLKKIITCMTLNRNYITYLFIIVLLSFYSCKSDESFEYFFPNDTEIVAIPFQYDSKGLMVCQIKIDGKDYKFIIDTGASISIISPLLVTNYDGKYNAVDVWGESEKLRTTKIKETKWGKLVIKNATMAVATVSHLDCDGIIGANILENFYFKIDNRKKILFVSTKQIPNTIDNTITRPFALTKDKLIYLDGQLFEEEPDSKSKVICDTMERNKSLFLFDTGSNEEFSINRETYNELNYLSEKLWEDKQKGLFTIKNDVLTSDSSSYFLSNFKLGATIFQNVITNYSRVKFERNILGTVFMRRFASITIDYPQKKIHFEFPKDSKPNNIKFSSTKIDIAPIAHWDLFFDKINSLGLNLIRRDSLFIVSSFLKEDTYKSINVGDTVIGIDDVLFCEKAWMSYRNNRKFRLETTHEKQTKRVLQTMYMANKADFHFMKQDSLITISTQRSFYDNYYPAFSYSYEEQNENWFYFMYNDKKNINRAYNLHASPWSTLIGKEFKMTAYKNGESSRITNQPPKIIE